MCNICNQMCLIYGTHFISCYLLIVLFYAQPHTFTKHTGMYISFKVWVCVVFEDEVVLPRALLYCMVCFHWDSLQQNTGMLIEYSIYILVLCVVYLYGNMSEWMFGYFVIHRACEFS